MGLIKCGNVVIPFDNQISKDTDLYKLYNTNIHEKIAEQKAREEAEDYREDDVKTYKPQKKESSETVNRNTEADKKPVLKRSMGTFVG